MGHASLLVVYDFNPGREWNYNPAVTETVVYHLFILLLSIYFGFMLMENTRREEEVEEDKEEIK